MFVIRTRNNTHTVIAEVHSRSDAAQKIRELVISGDWNPADRFSIAHEEDAIVSVSAEVRLSGGPNQRVDRAGEAGSASNELFDSEPSTGEKTDV